jgi:CHAT domain-containing protein
MLADLGLRKEALESELSRLSRDFNLERMAGKADIARLSSILPKDSSYLDYAKINVYDFQQQKFIGDYYLLFVLTPGQKQPVHLINLGKAEDVDRHITIFLREMNRPKTEGRLPHWEILKREGRAVYDLVLKPVESLIKDRKLFISPDGNLNLIPFEVLLDGKGKYLLENHDVGYVGAGRDIVKFTDQKGQKRSVLIMADPDYDVGLQEKEKIAGQMGVTGTRLRGIVSRDAVGMHFDRLPDTKPEADAIASILKDRFHPNVENYQAKKAMEEILFNVRNPWILHLATHGYFLKAEEVRQDENLGRVRMPQKESRVFNQGPAFAGIENPMLRSGIVLAGVNASLREGRDDGMVSAEKILGLRLKGTDLVVLSACETGVGDVQSGEGVFGLKRSFILSGAKTIVMSLWSVPSRETTELMTDFYARMSRGDSKSAALKHAKLKLMKKSTNPFFWGAFVMVGAQ